MFEEADVWAVAYGGSDRDYFEDVFERFDVALVGCDGVQGDYLKDDLENNPDFRNLGKNRQTSTRTLGKRIAKGNLVIAKQGTMRARAIGVVVEEYKYNPDWGEVQSWDLFHQIRVKWFRLPEDELFHEKPRPFGQSTAHHVGKVGVVEWARTIAERELTTFVADPRLQALPTAQRRLEDEELPSWLLEPKETAKSLMATWGWDGISEASVVAHILVPMLRELGWCPKQLRLEFDWIDIAVFDNSTDSEQPVLLVEAKAPRFGASGALRQGQRYRDEQSRRRGWNKDQVAVMATNGLSFKLQLGEHGSYSELFLLRPTSSARGFFEDMERLAHYDPS